MKLIVCLGDSLGMAFNRRRQSRDRAVTADIAEMTKGKKLFIDAYSEKLVCESGIEYEIAERNNIGDNYLFLETRSPSEYIADAESIVIYRWNRRYPADLFFDADLEKEGFKLESSEDIVGFSHEKITKEIYVK
jgi:hypothetical protein